MPWVAVIGLIAQVAGQQAAEAASRMDREEAMRLIQSVMDEFGQIKVPELQKLLLEKQGQTELTGIKDDPAYRAQQAAADAQLNELISSGGLTLADRAALNRIRAGSARQESAGRRAIEQGMAARGSLDSGAQLAMQLQENQQSAQSASEQDLDVAGLAQRRAFEAIRERAANAGSGLDRDYRRQSDRARAQDAINAGNLAIANAATRYNAGLPQQEFENRLRRAEGMAGPTYASAGARAAQAKDTQQRIQGQANLIGGVAQAGASGAQGAYNDYQMRNDFSGSDRNLPNQSTADAAFAGTNEGDFNQWPASSSGALGGATTRPQRKVIGRRLDGSPIYEDELGKSGTERSRDGML